MGVGRELERLLAYDAWANKETLGSLKATGAPNAGGLKILAHIVGADRLWWERISELPRSLGVWPDLTLEECERQFAELSRLFLSVSRPGLAREVTYTNSRGEEWSSVVSDILMHVVIHSAYHRGQIAIALRASGGEPAYTDFIHCIRQGFVE